jgi:hypothetical protein
MAKTTTLPLTQNFKIAGAYWPSATGTTFRILQSAGADYVGGLNDAICKSLMVMSNQATVSTFVFGLLDPSGQTVSVAMTASSTTAATSVTTTSSLSTATDTSNLTNLMLVTGTNVAAGTFISAIGSTSAFTLSRSTTGVPTGVVATPFNIIGYVTVPASSGGAAAGTTVGIDLLGSQYVTGLPFDQVGHPILHIPTGFKIVVANLTAPAANSGGFYAHAHIEEF